MFARYFPLVMLFVTCLIGTQQIIADSWVPLVNRDFQSSSSEYILSIDPNESPAKHPGRCKMSFFKLDENKRTERWSRYSINKVAPIQCFISNSGNYVVTLDEWGEFGSFPVVIYGPHGKPIRVHDINSLGLDNDKDLDKITITISSLRWNEDAIMFFGPREELVFIRLHWGTTLIIDLHDGGLYGDNDDKRAEQQRLALDQYAIKKTKELPLAKLISENLLERNTGAIVAGQLRIHASIPRLKELLNDSDYYETQTAWGSVRKIYYVRKSAKEALRRMEATLDGVVLED